MTLLVPPAPSYVLIVVIGSV